MQLIKTALHPDVSPKDISPDSNLTLITRYDEYRPWYKPDADIIHMISHCYVCDIDDELGDTAYESYEIKNGMRPLWMNIHKAIAHNENVMANSIQKGLSIHRETFLLKEIVNVCTRSFA